MDISLRGKKPGPGKKSNAFTAPPAAAGKLSGRNLF
jgi:hypothetical protein